MKIKILNFYHFIQLIDEIRLNFKIKIDIKISKYIKFINNEFYY